MVRYKSKSLTKQAWQQELNDLVRGASGGFLFGIPLIYTMEVWWIGSYAEPPMMLGLLGVTYIAVFLLNRTDGFRQGTDDPPITTAVDSVEAIAIGIVCVTCVLILLQEITWQTPRHEVLGKIIFEGVPFAVGVALTRSLINPEQKESDSSSNSSDASKPSQLWQQTLTDIGATLVGAMVIAFSIAPTDEVTMLASAVTPPWLLLIIAASLLVSYSIVFAAGFTSEQKRKQHQGIFQRPLIETAVSYLFSLGMAALMLWFFHRLSVSDPWSLWLNQVLILGLPATIGGAAGRLAV
ncbi:MAG: TIGR02587 family membrane protein [Aphanocapsa sp. GSE-SYN-MK-11-07L]|jgi:putative integral membrane protein (TIGR02587 family)|nr:TIGR02587 family membrane protein [Aphanocapsa sp. GSE-SYN-MK-11-07L]